MARGPGGVGGSSGAGGAGGVGGAGSGASSLSVPFFNLNTLGVRIVQYLVGLDIWRRHPILGVGGGNFRYAAASYNVSALEGLSLHNLYLSLLVGTGLVGLLLYALAVGFVALAGWRLLRADVPERTLVAGTLAGLLGFMAVAFWVLPLRFTYVVPAWLVAGAVVGRWRLVGDDRRPSPRG
jgi:O-antigen ligase